MTAADGLSCYCDPAAVQCNFDVTRCKFGIGLDACPCCPACLQGPGGSCGGPSDVSGRCGTGLRCQKSPPPDGVPAFVWEHNASGVCVNK
ncbi:unnamed protein product [Darwinula stevensoni]|uniref:IGFBP N-terminal domain-containing protein n=1 Tax=Darwinula stevensoni TaxID=69355 RepID=A0A7R9AG57_9CRUS|nr:unnamed protein product [Darwinula stevensoni]CAG0903979.1 unnamed protein product [Darwinula stevensoni]